MGKKLAWISLGNVCQSRDYGRLGLRKLQDHNTSFMMKLGFCIATESNALWVHVL